MNGQRAETIFRTDYDNIIRRTDRMFGGLLIAQWIGAIVVALVWSPRTWIAQYWSIHQHLLAATVLGGLFAAYPLYLIIRHPGTRLTRHMIAVGQMLQSALLVHVSGGRIETHFHVFGSLAMLAFYRDWTVLLTASAVVCMDHLALGFWFPLSVYGVQAATVWRSIEHAFWVVFEDVFLIMSCRKGIQELRAISDREAQLEEATTALQDANRSLEGRVEERTQDLDKANHALEAHAKDLERLAADLSKSNQELELLNKFMMGRETRIVELKEEIKALQNQLEARQPGTPLPLSDRRTS